jgi:hypothetical protein
LIQAIAQIHLSRPDAAQRHLNGAGQTWPADLQAEDAWTAVSVNGVFWFESADELVRLRDEASGLLDK